MYRDCFSCTSPRPCSVGRGPRSSADDNGRSHGGGGQKRDPASIPRVHDVWDPSGFGGEGGQVENRIVDTERGTDAYACIIIRVTASVAVPRISRCRGAKWKKKKKQQLTFLKYTILTLSRRNVKINHVHYNKVTYTRNDYTIKKNEKKK